MKAEKVLGIMACAIACASGSAFADTATNDWFSATVSETSLTLTNVTTNDAAVTVADSKIKLEDIESSAPFTFTPGNDNTAITKGDDIVVISTTADLTPCTTNDLMSTDVSGAVAGFAIGVDDDNAANTNFYGYANGAWVRLGGETPPYEGRGTPFKIVMNYRDSKVSFSVGGTDLYSAANNTLIAFDIDSSKKSLSNVAAFGSGAIASLSAGCEQAVAAVVVDESTTNRYGTIAQAIKAAGDDQTKIAVVDPATGATVSPDSPDAHAANGLAKWECEALQIAETDQVTLAKSGKQNAGQITLAVQNVTPETGLTVKYAVSVDGGAATGAYDADDIQIPMGETAGSHTYKIVPTITATAN